MIYVANRLCKLVSGIVIATVLSTTSALLAETDFTVPPGRAASPYTVIVGPDHNLWFAEQAGLKIGKITTAGVITEYSIPGAQALTGITSGPDGNIWFTDEFAGFVGRISTSGTGVMIFPITPLSHPQGITAGPDGNLWFVDELQGVSALSGGVKIGKITTSGQFMEYPTRLNAGIFSPDNYYSSQITRGPDGNLWFTNPQASGVGRNIVGKITTAGAVTLCNTADTPAGITSGPDGNLWVTENSHVAKVTTSCVETEYPITGSGSYGGITVGPDGNLWFTELTTIGYVTPAGLVTEFPQVNFYPTMWYLTSITSGPDGALWTLGNVTNNIGRVNTSGVLTNTYALNLGSYISVVTPGPDGAIWSTDFIAGMITRIDTSGTISNCPTPAGSRLLGLTFGPDGNLWYLDNGRNVVAKMTTSCAITEYSVGQRFAGLWTIIAGPDGNLWFTEYAPRYNAIVRITTDGAMTSYSIPTQNAYSLYITPGPDGNLWFTEMASQQVGKINPNTGQITEYPVPGSGLGLQALVTGPDNNLWILANTAQYGYVLKFSTTGTTLAKYFAQFETELNIVVGSDGALWFPQYYPNGVGRVTTSGVVSTVPLTSPNALPNSVAIGADGKVWVAETNAGAFGRLSAIGGTGDTIQATHGQPFNGAVASFVDGTPTAQSTDFTAMINWGDGTRNSGTVSGPTGGPFTVSGTHTYSNPGSYGLQISLHDNVDNATYQASGGTAQVQ